MASFVQQLLADLRAMPRELWVLVGGQFINRFGTFVHPFLALFLTREGLETGQVAGVLGAIALGNLAAPFAAGYLTDAIGRRNTIIVALVGGAVTILGIYACRAFEQLLVVAALHGFFAYMFGPAAHALLTDLVRPELRVIAYALLRLAINAGFAAGPAVAGLLFTRSPFLIFAGDAATTLAFALLAWAFLPHGLRTIGGRLSSPAVIARSWLEAACDVVRNGPFLQLLLGQLLMAAAFMQVVNVLALDATSRGLSPAAYGLLMGFNGLLIVLIELPLSQWVKRFNPRAVLAIGFAVVGLGCGAFAFAGTMAEFLAATALFTLGEMLSLPIASGYASLLAPSNLRGRYFGFQGIVWSMAAMAGSSGVWFHGHLGSAWWLWSGAVGIIAGLAMMPTIQDRRPVASVRAAVTVK